MGIKYVRSCLQIVYVLSYTGIIYGPGCSGTQPGQAMRLKRALDLPLLGSGHGMIRSNGWS